MAAIEEAVNQRMALRDSLREWEALEPIPDDIIAAASPSSLDGATCREAPASVPASAPASVPPAMPVLADAAADGATPDADSATPGANEQIMRSSA